MKSITISIAAVLIAATLATYVLTMNTKTASATGPFYTSIGVATTSAVTAITSSARILSTTTNTVGSSYTRVYATICNPNANPVYLSLDGDKAASATHYTTVIAAAAGYNACYEINDRNQYSGSVTASSTNQTSTTISATEYVQ